MHIDLIANVVSAWAEKHKSISRVWLFGSRVRGDHRDDSDIDIAVEVIALNQDVDCYSVWREEKPKLLSSISSQLPMPVHLEWCGGQVETPTIERGLLQSSLIVFERMSNSEGVE
ncbi:nucleotidyltransferase domain-containing protein [Pseudomonas chlororaphis]|uniref:nucleotidyltransferase family protein n=1 Tax=Pseudomonas chlororaphis TaxID=587753 RepID=UPI0006A5E65D|nr:nucleotidyltransferase domain-containing protein [Pseudomonas chlororaphis]WDG94029.1 nucleotidyltransferase domain-containing protein [Pseudomonas chlororaphis]SDT24961.1 Nucleotidyltransferase domain-containing protein [Pseudomonas chlororaphis]